MQEPSAGAYGAARYLGARTAYMSPNMAKGAMSQTDQEIVAQRET